MSVADPPRDDVYTALSHPLRRRILALMSASDRPFSPSELADLLDEKLSNVSYHVRSLKDVFALIRLVDEKQSRGSTEHFYVFTERARDSVPVSEAVKDADVPSVPQHRKMPSEQDFNRHVGRLKKVERRVVEYRQGWNGRPKKSRQEIAGPLGIGQEKVRQIERSGILKIELAMQEIDSDNGVA
jgi:DNA-directed RNA polymerase sigma subunit (sigma70/sigma32)